MKRIFNHLVALISATILVISTAAAQETEPNVGFVRIIHAIGAGQGKAQFSIDGENIFPRGYDLGQLTGGIGIKSGSHKISISREGTLTGTTPIQLAKGETLTLIAFAEKIPAPDPQQPVKWQIRILRLRQSTPEGGYQITFVSVCTPDEVAVKTTIQGRDAESSVYVQRHKTTSVRLGRSRNEVLIRHGAETLTTVSPDAPGNYIVLLYQDEHGNIRSISFFDPKFIVAG